MVNTIKQELRNLGIEQKYFDDFYHRMNGEIPAPENIPPNQYEAIVNYFIRQDVLDGKGRVNHLNSFNFTIRHMEDLAREEQKKAVPERLDDFPEDYE